MRRAPLSAIAVLLAFAVPVGSRAGGDAPKQERPAVTIELHIGVPGLAFIGQPLQEFLKKFPKAKVTPFSGQDDAVTVKANEAGISCIAVGHPGELKLASVGFNLDGGYEGMAEVDYRTREGIGKGSTVNDLLGVYGKPVDILGERPRGALRRPKPGADPPARQKYQYANTDGTVRTYFLVDTSRVTQVVINDLHPLEDHIVKAAPKKN